MDLAYDDVRYMVYRWGFHCFDYSFDVFISWSRKPDLYRWFCCVCFHRVLLWISSFIIIIIILYLFTSCLSLVFYSTSLLLLSYYTVHVPCLISISISLPVPVCLCSRHSFQRMFMIRIYRYKYACPCSLGIRHTTRWGVLTPMDSHVQISMLRACEFSQLLIRNVQWKRGSSADHPKPFSSRPPSWL